MLPKLIESLKGQKGIHVAASRNNTYILTSDGNLFGCGLNQFKQLGQVGVNKSLTPKMISLGKRLKGKTVQQIECSNFHCVLLTNTSEVFTFGLNAGQLGHPNEMVENSTSYNNSVIYISEPRLITTLNEPDLKIDLIACSDGCTVCVQHSKNVIYVFNEYKYKRMNYVRETSSKFKKVRVYGGRLDHNANTELKCMEDLSDPLVIVGLTETNFLFIWRENDPVWKSICWSPNKKLQISDFDLNTQGLIICTIQGSCYRAQFIKTKITKPASTQLNQSLTGI